ncbi:MAG TPA: flagellar export protein FliJ [Steroidobacteraceae bacterium]|nr:flagellar export protein FliJ [Steroidobacteraceae bacterium]
MKRAQRLDMVQRVVDDSERGRAQSLAASERRLKESETKLSELRAYQDGYMREFSRRAGNGIDSASARDYQAFLARLEEALKQQTQAVTRARAQRDAAMSTWQGAALRAQAVGQMVKRFQTEQEQALDRREQSESDERSQRAWIQGLIPRGA